MLTSLEKNYASDLKTFEGFNLVDFIILPHWGKSGEHANRRKRQVSDAFKEENKIILLNDYQYVRVEDDMYRIVDIRID